MRKLVYKGTPYSVIFIFVIVSLLDICSKIEDNIPDTKLLFLIIITFFLNVLLALYIHFNNYMTIDFLKEKVVYKKKHKYYSISLRSVENFEYISDRYIRIILKDNNFIDVFCTTILWSIFKDFKNIDKKINTNIGIAFVEKANKKLIEYRKQNNLD
jgi:hypothetical protein